MGGGHDLKARRIAAGESELHDKHIVPGKSTGVPIVDKGTACERHPDRGDCWLTEDKRVELLSVLGDVVGDAMDNFRTAIGNVRTELLTTTVEHSAWITVATILLGIEGALGLFSGSLIAFRGLADTAAKGGAPLTIGLGYELPIDFAKRVAKINPRVITGTVSQINRHFKTKLSAAAHRPAGVSKENAAAADFCTVFEEHLTPLAQSIREVAPTKLDDFEIAAMVASYKDPNYHSIAAYEEIVRKVIDRFKSQHLADIGDGQSTGEDRLTNKKAVIVLGKGGAKRHAIVEYYEHAYAKTSPIKGVDGKPVPWDQPVFISWIDADLAPVAIGTQLDRYGDMPVIDATAQATGMASIDTWAADPTKGSP